MGVRIEAGEARRPTPCQNRSWMTEIELAECVGAVAREEWDGLVGDGSPFLEWDFLVSLEQAGCVGAASGWEPRPLLVREGGALVAACPLYLKGNSEGEFVFDFAWAEAAHRAGFRYYPKLLVGVPFTPVTGARFLVRHAIDRGRCARLLGNALRELCASNGLSGVHVNFCLEEEMQSLVSLGFLPRIGLQYHWRNEGYASFDDFTARFRSKRRNQIARERRSLAGEGVSLEVAMGHEIPETVFPDLFRIYRSTIDKNPWGRQYLNARFFKLLAERFRHRLCVVLARRNGALLAGTVNVQKGSALYGRYWGALREIRNLHYNVCYYAAVEHCIRSGLERFEPGAGGDYKQMRGFDATPTFSAHFILEPRLAAAVEHYLERERAQATSEIRWLREHSALKPRGS
ncbi:MAG TPA: GNAT family N-acetyltransferase [Deltaproteobacteria bacterium]|nr:GNAT family N-acetyltransferase [Deltaproteobacteria bacterium]